MIFSLLDDSAPMEPLCGAYACAPPLTCTRKKFAGVRRRPYFFSVPRIRSTSSLIRTTTKA